MSDSFIVPINRLSAGKNAFQWHLDGSFFDTFENSEILAADLEADVVIFNDDYDIRVEGKIKGSVTVQCDRCLADLTLPVDTTFDDDEFEDCDSVDLRQDLYDFVCISLPMQRVHEDGGCDEETVKYLSK